MESKEFNKSYLDTRYSQKREKYERLIRFLEKIYLGFLFENIQMKEKYTPDIRERIKDYDNITLADFTKEYLQIDSLKISLI